MNLKHPDHPIWSIVNTAVLGGIAIGALYVTASHFDATEIKAWAPIMTAVAGSEMMRHYLRKRQEPSKQRDTIAEYLSRQKAEAAMLLEVDECDSSRVTLPE